MLADVDQASAISEPLLNTSDRRVSARVVLGGLFLFALWFVLCRHLSNEWSVNEQYSYGWFVPFFAAYLFWLRWETRGEMRNAECGMRNAAIALAIAILALVILLPVRLFEVGNPDWRPLGWLHTGAVTLLTGLVIWAAGGRSWVRHFAFPLAFFFVAVPWPATFEQTVVQGLMRLVASVATETLTLFGIPAQVEGNLIRVSSGLVGVNEACSGVRSLQTSLMLGLLFGELKRLSALHRVGLVAAALAVAFIANCGRAFFLVWLAATREPAAVSRWHDLAGYVIVAVVFIATMAIASALGRNNKVGIRNYELGNERPASQNPSSHFLLSTFYFLLPLLWLLAVEIGVEIWYRSHERQEQQRTHWQVKWPESAPHFHEIPIDEGVKSILRFDAGREVSWLLGDAREPSKIDPVSAAENNTRALLFFFRWEPGGSSILRARAHRPDICLPSAGWRQTADAGVRTYPITGELALPFRHFSFARDKSEASQLFAHAFFCVHEDFVRPTQNQSLQFDPNSQLPSDWLFSDRWNVVREGLRNPGQQVLEMVFVSQNEIPESNAETTFASVVRELVAVEK